MSSREKTGPLISVSIICIDSIGQLRLVLSIIVFNWRASRTILSDSSFLSIITGLINVSPLTKESVFTRAELSKCVRMTSKCCTRSSNCKGIRVACCFLNTAVAYKGRFNSTLIFPTSN